jgi:hypothetical protein
MRRRILLVIELGESASRLADDDSARAAQRGVFSAASYKALAMRTFRLAFCGAL